MSGPPRYNPPALPSISRKIPTPLRRRKQLRDLLISSPTAGLETAIAALTDHPIPTTSQASPLRHAIIVLGVPVLADGSLSDGLQLRTARAAQVAQQHPAAVIIVTGGAVANIHGEAEAMARDLIRLGIEEGRIWVEGNARTTLDNAAFTTCLLERIWPPFQPGNRGQHQENDSQRDSVDSHLTSNPSVHLTIVSEPYHAIRSLRHFAAALTLSELQAQGQVVLHAGISEMGNAPIPAMFHNPNRGRGRARDGSIWIGGLRLRGEVRARLERCLEEKRRIAFLGFDPHNDGIPNRP
ncbi:hypothetical protein FFLO_02573 [Filobasidium floriforme]|uniref:DUF218 domain-containing protein n=1 Tax=Filobasidium floriforme TaxID=5210 RepID=A0A8K0JNY1_9TREE|nr:hypothetical protein FFLO_02573 [Filobasidium floriforme]